MYIYDDSKLKHIVLAIYLLEFLQLGLKVKSIYQCKRNIELYFDLDNEVICS